MFTDELLSVLFLDTLVDDDAPEIPSDGIERLSWSKLRPSQLRGVQLIEQCFAPVDKLPGVLIAFPCGGGKTGVTLQALRRLLDRGEVLKPLIIAPLLVAQTGWPDELGEWEETRQTTFTLLRVEDDDTELVAYSDQIYQRALRRYQAVFEAHVAREPALKATQARGAVRFRWKERAIARRKDKEPLLQSPGDLAGKIRDFYALRFKYAKLARLAAQDTELHIVNKEALPWLWDHFGAGRRWPYDALILDDLREGRSGRKRVNRGRSDEGKAAPLSRFGILARARKKVKATIQLCGTPTPRGLENVWGLSYLVDLGERLGTDKKAFMDRWFWSNTYTRETKPHDHSFNEIVDKIRDIMFSVNPDELAAELPGDPIINPIRVKLPRKVLNEYKTFERRMVSEQYDVEAVNAGVLHNKLLQFANGSMYQEDGSDIWIHDCKIEALKELVTGLDGIPLLVAYTYQFDVERICKAFPNAEVLKPSNAIDIKRRWNADEIPILLAHRASAGHGLNLQKGVGQMCEYGLTSDAELFAQFLFRLQRPGRKHPVINHVLIAEGTIDEKIYPMYLDPKLATQNRFLEAIRINHDLS